MWCPTTSAVSAASFWKTAEISFHKNCKRDLYGNKALKESQCRNGFIKFCLHDFSLKDEPRSGRPSNVDEEDIKAAREIEE